MSRRISRRTFLQLGAWSLLGAAFRSPNVVSARRPLFFGRVIFIYATLYRRPSVYAPTSIVHELESVLPIYAEAPGEDESAYNKRWYETDGGYIHSTNVQPVLNKPNQPQTIAGSQLGEVTVPAVDALTAPRERAAKLYRLYYGSTHWIVASHTDAAGEVWYELADDRTTAAYFVPAVSIRLVALDELRPLSPQVTDKQIQIDTTAETITALEYGRPVFTTRISSGGEFGPGRDFRTPLGEYRIDRKRPSRHMAAGDGAADDAYDLPGVPWVSYFNGGIAIHGTYWHNDFGRPWSHGCINLLTQDAKWFYRWTTPLAALSVDLVEGSGTPVIIV